MKFRLLCIFPLLAFAAYGECCCCDDGDDFNPDGGPMDGEGNCIQVSVEQCEAYKQSLSLAVEATYDDITQFEVDVHTNLLALGQKASNEVVPLLQNAKQYLDFVRSEVGGYDTTLQNADTTLSQALSTLETNRALWESMGSGILDVTNVTNGGKIRLKNARNPATWIPTIIEPLTSLRDDIQHVASTLEAVQQPISQIDSYLEQSIHLLGSFYSDCERAYQVFAQGTENIRSQVQTINNLGQTLNCSACNSSGSGSGGGSGSTYVDLTPVVVAIETLEDTVKDQLVYLRQQIDNFFSDYDSARSYRASGKMTYSRYASSDNWFVRVENLLYSISGLTEDSDETSGQDTSQEQAALDESESKVQEMSQDIQSHQEGDFNTFMNRIKSIFEKFTFLGSGTPTVTYVTQDFQFGDFTIPSLTLGTSQSAVTQIATLIRYAFQLLYLLGTGFIVFQIVIWSYHVARDVILFVLKIYSAVFGS